MVNHIGISRRIQDEDERKRLREIIENSARRNKASSQGQ